MTTPELEDYLTRLLPSLQSKLIKEHTHNDLLQEVLIWLFTHSDQVTVSGDEPFIALVSAHFYRRMSILTMRVNRNKSCGDYIGDNLLVLGVSTITNGFYNKFRADNRAWVTPEKSVDDPWENNVTQALEYLEFITEPRLKRIMFQFYIEGYTLTEIAQQLGVSAVRVHQLLERGVGIIKTELFINEST